MKKYFRIMMAATAVLAASCSVIPEEIPSEDFDGQTFAVYFDDEDPDTKTAIGSDNKTVTWLSSDIIGIVDASNSNTEVRATVQSRTNNNKRAIFRAEKAISTPTFATLPFVQKPTVTTSASGQTCSINIETVQSGSFKDAHIAMGYVESNGRINFKNACGIFQFEVYDSNVNQILVEGPGVAGAIKYDKGSKTVTRDGSGEDFVGCLVNAPGTYYLAVRNGVYRPGDLTFYYGYKDKTFKVCTFYDDTVSLVTGDILLWGNMAFHAQVYANDVTIVDYYTKERFSSIYEDGSGSYNVYAATPVLTPSNATYKKITWKGSSSDLIFPNGNTGEFVQFYAKKAGTYTLTCEVTRENGTTLSKSQTIKAEISPLQCIYINIDSSDAGNYLITKKSFNTKYSDSEAYIDKVVASTSVSGYNYYMHCTMPVTLIPSSAFEKKKLKAIKLPDKVKVIGPSAFYWCPNLETVEFNKGLEEIQNGAFYTDPNSYKGIKYFTFPSTLKKIGEYAFKDVRASSIEIPASVTYIGYMAFHDSCLMTLKFKGKTPPTSSDTNGSTAITSWYGTFGNDITIESGFRIQVPSSALSAYKSSKYFKEYADKGFIVGY